MSTFGRQAGTVSETTYESPFTITGLEDCGEPYIVTVSALNIIEEKIGISDNLTIATDIEGKKQ